MPTPCFKPQITSGTRIVYVKEVNCAFPGGAVKELRKTSFTLADQIDNVTSNEINSGRQISDRTPVGGNLSGQVGFELSYGEYDPFIENVMQNSFTTLSTVASDISITNTTTIARVAGSWIADGFIPGIWIKLAGFGTAANNGIFKVLTVTALTMTLRSSASATPMVIEAAGASITVTANYISNDSIDNSFYMEFFLNKLGKHLTYNNVQVNNMNMDFTAKSLITGTLDLLGTESAVLNASASSSIVAPGTNKVMNTTSNVKDISLGGVILAGFANKFDIAMGNSMSPRDAVGQFAGVGQLSGDFEVTGNFSLYLSSTLEYENWKNNVVRSLDWKTIDGAGNTYVFDIPSFKWTSNPITAPGRGQDIFLNGAFGSIADTQTGKSMFIHKL